MRTGHGKSGIKKMSRTVGKNHREAEKYLQAGSVNVRIKKAVRGKKGKELPCGKIT